jgi:hypothetical protein
MTTDFFRVNMLFLLPLLNFLALSCSEPKDRTEEEIDGDDIEDSAEACPPGGYPGLLQLWQERNENDEEPEYAVDPPPDCEIEIEIEIIDEGGIASSGECIVGNGQNSRSLLFEFSGVSDEPNLYSGQVYFTKPNGEQQQDTFYGSCTQTETDILLSFEWFMTVSTPHGEIEHHGKLTSPATEVE